MREDASKAQGSDADRPILGSALRTTHAGVDGSGYGTSHPNDTRVDRLTESGAAGSSVGEPIRLTRNEMQTYDERFFLRAFAGVLFRLAAFFGGGAAATVSFADSSGAMSLRISLSSLRIVPRPR